MMESSHAPKATNGNMVMTILASSCQSIFLRCSTASRPHPKKPVVFKMETEFCSPSVYVPTGMQNMLPANPVMACTVYPNRNTTRKMPLSIL